MRKGRPAFETVHGSGFFEHLATDPHRERNGNDWNTVTAKAWLPPVIEALELLRRCREAMKPGARLLIVEQMMPERGDPARRYRALTELNLWLGWGGSIPERSEWESLLANAGFSLRRASEPVSPVFAWQVIEAAPV